MKHLFFDLDHTLWDFDKNSEAALRILYAELALDRFFKSFQSFHHAYKKINAEMWFQYSQGKLRKEDLRIGRFHQTLRQFNINDLELAEELASGYVRISPFQPHLFPGTKETLSALVKDGFRLHIITNGFQEIQETKLRNTEIRDFFDTVLCSEAVGKQKPHPNVFEAALKGASASKQESVMIGDNLHTDVIGAHNFGLSAILFDPHSQHSKGTHEWHIQHLKEVPELLPWIARKNVG